MTQYEDDKKDETLVERETCIEVLVELFAYKKGNMHFSQMLVGCPLTFTITRRGNSRNRG